MNDCEHKYQYAGIVYHSTYQIPGSGAYAREYEDKFFCEKCLSVKYANARQVGNSYTKPIEGTFPK